MFKRRSNKEYQQSDNLTQKAQGTDLEQQNALAEYLDYHKQASKIIRKLDTTTKIYAQTMNETRLDILELRAYNKGYTQGTNDIARKYLNF